MENRSVILYLINRLSFLSDEEIREVDFTKGLSILDNIEELSTDEKNQIKTLFIAIEKEISLKHHGVLGQRWGVRRYQNKDGTLTKAGREKLAKENARKSIFGTPSKFSIETRTGEILTAEPVKPWSTGKKIINALLGINEKDMLGRRGDANYILKNSKGDSIGELSLISKSENTAYLDWITINESNRGNGYATDILDTLINSARNTGYKKLELNALKNLANYTRE